MDAADKDQGSPPMEMDAAEKDQGSPGMAIEALNIRPLSFELPKAHRAPVQRKREYIAYHTQRITQMKKAKAAGSRGASPVDEVSERPVDDSESVNAAKKLHFQHSAGSRRRSKPEEKPVAREQQRFEREQNDREQNDARDAARNKQKRNEKLPEEQIKAILTSFHALVRRMKQEEDTAAARARKLEDRKNKMHQKAARILKSSWEKLPRKNLGCVPGIKVGEKFESRWILHILGLHRPLQAGIDYLSAGETGRRLSLATSIVVSGGYEDNIDNGDVLIYTGHGGNDYERSKKQVTDQKLTSGNKALVNSCSERQPVRVFRLRQEKGAASDSTCCRTFRYDGLYDVERCWLEEGRSGFQVYKFKLRRQKGQPPLFSGVVSFVGNSQGKNAGPVIKEDIAEGQEMCRIPVVNSVDDMHAMDEFTYLLTVKYPAWLGKPPLPEGCRCVGGCADAMECLCARRNGGKFPYSSNGVLVRANPMVYECGPSCRCPPGCRNRVTQHRLKHKLEVFRTRRRDWGVRTLEFIEGGAFVAEITGDLVTFVPAAADNKMIFPISPIAMEGNWGDLRGIVEDGSVSALPSQILEDLGFKVDASASGNVTRFISRSVRPNLFAQYVVYDHHDTTVPHVMLFASENISPQLELAISMCGGQSIQGQRIQRQLGAKVESKTRMGYSGSKFY